MRAHNHVGTGYVGMPIVRTELQAKLATGAILMA
jgi:hypothetical protein